jgi:hypothetical protein
LNKTGKFSETNKQYHQKIEEEKTGVVSNGEEWVSCELFIA